MSRGVLAAWIGTSTSGSLRRDAGQVSLASMPEGVVGRIASLDAAAGDVQRLQVMGLCEGRVVQVVKQGDPMIVRVLGTSIGLAAVLAQAVRVRGEAAGAPEGADAAPGAGD